MKMFTYKTRTDRRQTNRDRTVIYRTDFVCFDLENHRVKFDSITTGLLLNKTKLFLF